VARWALGLRGGRAALGDRADALAEREELVAELLDAGVLRSSPNQR
jgi:hypothetical protein